MKLKLNKDGSAVVRNGMPVYVHANGREEAFDAPAAWKLALGKHFETSPVMAGLKIPHDLAAAAFSDAFRIEGGKLVAVDKHGITMYSPTRHGEAADFSEAFAQLVDRYENKGMIQRETDAAPANSTASAGQQFTGKTIARSQFDALPPLDRAQFFKDGGRIGDAAIGSAPAPAALSPGAKVVTRAQFEQMPHIERPGFFKAGGKVEG